MELVKNQGALVVPFNQSEVEPPEISQQDIINLFFDITIIMLEDEPLPQEAKADILHQSAA